MALDHDGYDFGSHPHTPVTAVGDATLRLQINEWFGVLGEAHIDGGVGGVPLACEITPAGYADKAALGAYIDEVRSKKGILTGTLTETIDGVDETWVDVTFVDFVPLQPAFKDGVSGQWAQFARLLWRWRQPVT